MRVTEMPALSSTDQVCGQQGGTGGDDYTAQVPCRQDSQSGVHYSRLVYFRPHSAPKYVTVVRLQEIPSGSIFKKSSKTEQNCRLFLDIFNSAIQNECFVHDFYIQAQGGCQLCLSAVKLDDGGELFWDTPSWLSAWVSVCWAWRMDLKKGIPTLFAYCEKLTWNFFLKFKQVTRPWMAFAWKFPGFLQFFFRVVYGANHL